MRDHSSHVCIASEEAVSTILAKIAFEPRVEHVRIEDALDRVTAEPCYCAYDLPNKLGSRMDAISVYFDDFADGMPDVSTWKRGVNWEFANTGTAIEGDFDTCIVIEQVELDEHDELVAIKKAPKERGAMTIPVGSRHQKGQLIVDKGVRITPAKMSALAMAGIAQVPVVAKPRVVFIPTGDELVPVNFPLPLGKTFEANSLMLGGKLVQWGAEYHVHPILGDDWEAIRAAVLAAVREYDIVILNAGSSKGSKDFNIEILEEEGEVLYHEVNHGPGHHSSCAVIDGTPVVGISGPPSGAEYTADWYLRPLVEAYLYGAPLPVRKIKARMAHPLPDRKKHPGEGGMRMFGAKRVILTDDGAGGFEASIINRGGQAELIGEDQANAFLRVYDELEGAPAGTEVEVELRYPYTYPGAVL